MRLLRIMTIASACIASIGAVTAAHHTKAIKNISLSAITLNTAANSSVTLFVTLARPGQLAIEVIDRDGFVIRHLSAKNGIAGANAVSWNGRSDQDVTVPDEAYSFRVRWSSDRETETYFPAAIPTTSISIDALSYSRTTATLSYNLPTPSRVHVQAGVSVPDDVSGENQGPVLKNVVDRQPRTKGRIAEYWSGFDEGGSIYVPDLKNFAIAIAAMPLAANSVITIGNSRESFVDYASRRSGQSLFAPAATHQHHHGLDVFNDLAPRMTVKLDNASYDAKSHEWTVCDSNARARITNEGPTAPAFARQPASLYAFVDFRKISKTSAPSTLDFFSVPLNHDDIQTISFDWVSDYGPVAVSSIKVRRKCDGSTPQPGETR